jgi:di/tricarboxylate transporter
VIFLIACMMPLGIAMNDQHTGTARWLAEHVVRWTGGYGPLVVLASLFLFTTLVTEVMSNAAAAVLVAPIGVAIAVGLGLEPYPFLMAIAIGASTTFLTPIGHQANVLVYGVGNYRFMDFPRVGLLLNLLVFRVTLLVVPIVWPFTPLAASLKPTAVGCNRAMRWPLAASRSGQSPLRHAQSELGSGSLRVIRRILWIV